MKEKVDILVFGAHPDDVELGCSGTIMKHIELGYKMIDYFIYRGNHA